MVESVSFEVILPDGKPLPMYAAKRNGKFYLARLPPQNGRENVPPRTLESRAAFAQAAYKTYGSSYDGSTAELPVQAEAVARELPERARSFTSPRNSQRAKVKKELAELVGEEKLRQIRELLGVELESIPKLSKGAKELLLPWTRREETPLRLPERRATSRLSR